MARNQRKYNTEYITGHADITTTMNIYAEAAKEKKQGAIANWNGKNHVKKLLAHLARRIPKSC